MWINCWNALGWKNLTDRRNLETHIQNQYTSEIKNLKAKHQQQIASIETKITEKMQNKIKNIQVTSDIQIAKYMESIQLPPTKSPNITTI